MSSESDPEVATEATSDPYRPPDAEPVAIESVDSSTLLQGVLTGIGILFLHLVFIWVPAFGLMTTIFAGFTQWLIVVPLAVHWRRKGRHAAVRGLLILAGIAFLLTATCTGFVLFNLQLH